MVSFGYDLELNYEKKNYIWFWCMYVFLYTRDLFKGWLRLELGLGCFRFWLCLGLSIKYRYDIESQLLKW